MRRFEYVGEIAIGSNGIHGTTGTPARAGSVPTTCGAEALETRAGSVGAPGLPCELSNC
jgi:hypothetical protein